MAKARRSVGNLPAELTSFVGRQRELSRARQVLARSRLLTLTGPAGIGKTRLALRLAYEVRRSFPDGTWLVDLSSLDDEALLVRTVVTALGIDPASPLPSMDLLVSHLAGRRMLLILDNCEHRLEPCAAFVRTLLAAAPDIQVVATSRQALGVDGEFLLTVPPLSAPDPKSSPTPAAMERYDAVLLFVERASAAVGEFTLTAEDGPPVAGVCHLLDGIPLAIELATAWLRVLSPKQLLSGLEDHFSALNYGGRATPRSQQNVCSAMAWSYGLCTTREQLGWARLSVFSGGFDLEAAEAVFAAEPGRGAEGQTLEMISGLVDKSILIREGSHGMPRYRMLVTIRHHGVKRLRESHEETAVRRRHRDHYQRLAARAALDWFSPRQDSWYTRLCREHGNIRAALDFCLSTQEEAHAGLRMLSSLWSYVLSADDLDEERHWLGQALALDQQPSPARAKALWVDGWLSLLRGENDVAKDRLTECRTLADHLGDPETVTHAAELGGLVALFEDDLEVAVALLEEALRGHRARKDLWSEWTALFLLALARCLTGDSHARTTVDECLALCDAHDARWSRSYARWLLGLHHWVEERPARAISCLEDALRLSQPSRDVLIGAQCLEVLGWAIADQGRWEPAAVVLGAARTQWAATGTALPGAGRLLRYHTACEERLRRALGDSAFETAVQTGTALSPIQAAQRALGIAPAATPTTTQPADIATSPLTRREHQVVALLAKGLTDKQIAAKLVISPRTAEGHVRRILAKLGCASRTQVATWAITNLVKRS
ncbi:ATP-binding protein [Streptomyces cucumeris]|uniref:ATP-binding protein n=1 Tax=Streptomyces cucumeris TaxID=2962890 RepID=UPI003EBBDEB9